VKGKGGFGEERERSGPFDNMCLPKSGAKRILKGRDYSGEGREIQERDISS